MMRRFPAYQACLAGIALLHGDVEIDGIRVLSAGAHVDRDQTCVLEVDLGHGDQQLRCAHEACEARGAVPEDDRIGVKVAAVDRHAERDAVYRHAVWRESDDRWRSNIARSYEGIAACGVSAAQRKQCDGNQRDQQKWEGTHNNLLQSFRHGLRGERSGARKSVFVEVACQDARVCLEAEGSRSPVRRAVEGKWLLGRSQAVRRTQWRFVDVSSSISVSARFCRTYCGPGVSERK